MIEATFWGVRGSLPCPGPATVKYGGNTACIELRFDGRLIIIDAGTGIRLLANKIMQHDMPNGPIDTSIFLTHTHWDHIMGFPFFIPIFVPGTKLNVYGPVTFEDEGLDEIVGGQLTYRYFPVKHSELAADIKYINLKEKTLDLGDGIFVTTKYLNHPILCLGYRFEFKGRSFVTLYDTEPFRNVFPTDPEDPDYDEIAAEEGEKAANEENEKILRFIQGADAVVYDSQYTYKEYNPSKLGWGHSYFEFVVNAAHKAGVKKVYFFHHDPMRTDDQLDELLNTYSNRIAGKSNVQLAIAQEGLTVTLE